MRSTNVRQHTRRTPSGKVTSVTRHQRSLGDTMPVKRAPKYVLMGRDVDEPNSPYKNRKLINIMKKQGLSLREASKYSALYDEEGNEKKKPFTAYDGNRSYACNRCGVPVMKKGLCSDCALARRELEPDEYIDYRGNVQKETASKALEAQKSGSSRRELEPVHDRAKSFYKKAVVKSDGDKRILQSYGTNVAEYDLNTGKAKVYGTYSSTTLRHIKEFLKQQGLPADTKKQIESDYETS